MAKNYKPDENGKTKCVECGQVIHQSDEYYWVKQRGKFGKVIFIHKDCYEGLLPKKNIMEGSDEGCHFSKDM